MEIVVGIVLADEEWTPVNGLVRATKKEILGAYGKS